MNVLSRTQGTHFRYEMLVKLQNEAMCLREKLVFLLTSDSDWEKDLFIKHDT